MSGRAAQLAAFSTDVAVRWSDMDVYGHVNNARVVTLLEEARTELLFGEGARRGAKGLADGVVVVELVVRYRQPLVYSAAPVRVRVWVSELRAASFSLDYTVTAGDGDAVTARTQLAPYDTGTQRPRRLMPGEREFLAAFRPTQPM
ncbi:MAG TPA: thioesterase family protein [Pseudonocardiaceae bacterium]|nr:thioesterase family protein [Pseudonocardiaceae bacterium]